MRIDLFDYALPPELIAQHPVPRGQSRLLVVHRNSGKLEHRTFPDLLDYLNAGDALVLNDTRVSARRLRAQRAGGEAAEVFLMRPVGEASWEALVKPGKSLRPGKSLTLFGPQGSTPVQAQVIATTPEGGRVLALPDTDTRDSLVAWGETPLPPYIHEHLPPEQEERYQTVYAAEAGSAAAPTAGLHFTPDLLAQAEAKGVGLIRITLHIGVGTFRPVRTETVEAHEMHAETAHLGVEAARRINATSGCLIAVGTTSVRTLETAAVLREAQHAPGRVVPFAGDTRIYITPGYPFRAVDALVTNFHLPRSTLLLLVSAFASRELILHAYAEAVREEYRFFSFGDAMLIL